MKAKILLVEDEPSLQLALGDLFAEQGWEVVTVGTVAQAQKALEERPHVVVCDLRLPDGDGFTVVHQALAQGNLPVIVLTAYGTVEKAVEAMKLGAADFLIKPFAEEQLLSCVKRNLELSHLRRRLAELEQCVARPLGDSPAFRRVLELAQTVAATDITVLLQGETGTGKEVLARFIHQTSPRKDGPFVAVNCAALPETLLEDELFGHEKGAFTGAIKVRLGRFEEAHGGTLFLDEVGEMSLPVQAKLLRVLQEHCFQRLGGNRSIAVDVRVIAATQRNLAEEVKKGNFREDLYWRLMVVPITLPPLRQRQEDIPLLATYFARQWGEKLKRSLTFAPETLSCLAGQPFRGNVRELEHLVQRLAATCPQDLILPEHLPPEYQQAAAPLPEGTLEEQLKALERQILLRTLQRFAGHREQTARALGISRKTLWEKLKIHGLAEKDNHFG
ncbi:MAG: sigma-54-dependent transcriptional regulator [Thermoanaerobaculaceae bacterium]